MRRTVTDGHSHAAPGRMHADVQPPCSSGFDEASKALLHELQGKLTTEHRRAVQRLEAKISALETESSRLRRNSVEHRTSGVQFMPQSRRCSQESEAPQPKEPRPKKGRSRPSISWGVRDSEVETFTIMPCLADLPQPGCVTVKKPDLVSVHPPPSLDMPDDNAQSPVKDTAGASAPHCANECEPSPAIPPPNPPHTKTTFSDEQPQIYKSKSNSSNAESEEGSEVSEPWEHTFRVLDAWNRNCRESSFHQSFVPRAIVNVTKVMSRGSCDNSAEDKGWVARNFQRLMVHPTSTKRLIWEFFALFLILLDVLVIPLRFLDPPRNKFMLCATWGTRIFWTVDIVFSFFTGCPCQTEENSAEMRPLVAAKRYIRTKFPFDFIIVLCDWLEIGVREMGDVGLLQLVMIIRAFRVLRIVRIMKARNVTDFLLERIRSEVAWIVTYVLGILLALGLLIHVTACIWFGIEGDDGNSEVSFMERYMLSFHFVLALFVGEHVFLPRNTYERIFTIIILMFAFVVSASFVGSLTTAMTRLQILASQRSAMFATLTRYLTDCGVSRKLQVRVQRNAHHAFRERRRNTPENSVELLSLISDPLRAEIHYEVYIPILARHPFFFFLDNADTTGMRQICHGVVSEISISRGDVLFSEFEVPTTPKLFFIVSGKLSYNRGVWEQMKVEPTHWACEPSLWTTWAHLGSLVARAECQFLAIDAHRFVNITSHFPSKHANVYADKFVRTLNSGLYLTDIGEDNEQTRGMVYDSFEESSPGTIAAVTKGRSSFVAADSYQSAVSKLSKPSSLHSFREYTGRAFCCYRPWSNHL